MDIDLQGQVNAESAGVRNISGAGGQLDFVLGAYASKGGKSFNPTTGLTTEDTGFSQTNTPSAVIGTPIDIAMMPLLYTDEESMNVTIEVLDGSDNVLATKVVPNVPFKRNRQTTLTGAVFSAEASSAAFKLETSWLASETVPF